MARTLGIVRRKDLSSVAEGWEGTYVIYRPASLGELADSQKLNPEQMNEQEGVAFLVDFVKQHVVSGKVMVVGDDGQLQLVDLEPADVDYFPADLLNSLFADMAGGKLDPKDTQPAALTAAQPSNDAAPTVTP